MEGYKNKLLIGGIFDRVGPYQPHLARYSVKEQKIKNFPYFPFAEMTNSPERLTAIISDGQDGWYVAGNFERLGDFARQDLAHINSDGVIQPLSISTNGEIKDLLLLNQKLYICGHFDTIQGKQQHSVAVLDLQTGLLSDWDANLRISFANDLTVYKDILFIGGYLNYWNGPFGTSGLWNILAVDLHTGRILPHEDWKWLYDELNLVNGNGLLPVKEAVIEGDYLAVSLGLTSFIYHLPSRQQAYSPNFAVTSLTANNGYIYIANTDKINRFDISTQTYKPFLDLSQGAGSTIFEMAFTDSSTWLGGSIRLPGDSSAVVLAEYDLNTVVPTNNVVHAFTKGASSSTPGLVNLLAINGDELIVGGGFHTIGALERKNFYEFDLVAGKATDWNPDPNGRVHKIMVEDDRIYIAGEFDQIAGQNHKNFAVFDSARQLLPTFNYPFTGVNSGRVQDFEVTDTSIYLAGEFDAIGGYKNNALMVVDKQTGNILPFQIRPDGGIDQIEIIDSTIFIHGYFSTYYNPEEPDSTEFCDGDLAFVHAESGKPRGCWSNRASTGNHAEQIKAFEGKLYVLGSILVGGPNPKVHQLGTIDPETLLNDSVELVHDGQLHSFDLACGKLLLQGEFATVNGEEESKLAIVDLQTGAVEDNFNNIDQAAIEPGNFKVHFYNGKLYSYMDYANEAADITHRGLVSHDLGCLTLSPGFILDFNYQPHSGQIQFQNLSSDPTLNFSWDFGDGNYSEQFSPVHSYLHNGSYSVRLFASDGCSMDTFTQQIQVGNVGFDDISTTQMILYPNPNDGHFILKTGKLIPGDYQVRIFDGAGKLQERIVLSLNQGENEIRLSLPDLSSGIYYLTLFDGRRQMGTKFIKNAN